MASTGLALAFLIAPVAAVEGPAPQPPGMVLISVESRVEVDATGAVVAVEPKTALPAPIAEFLAADIRRMRFAPPLKDGKPVAGVTFAQQDACAAPDQGGAYRFAVKYRGNGPALVQRLAPVYPREAMRRGQQSRWLVSFSVAADGSASLLEARRTDGVGPGGKDFHAAIVKWVAALRYQPELLEGQPVSTTISIPVEFRVDPFRGPADHAINDSCTAALEARDDDDREVALNSPFKTLPLN